MKIYVEPLQFRGLFRGFELKPWSYYGCQDIHVPPGDHQTHLCEGLEEYGHQVIQVLGSSESLEDSMLNKQEWVLDVAHMLVLYHG